MHELKLDGYRAQASFHDGRAMVYSRRGNDWTARFGSIGAALQHLPANGFVIDGEVVVPDDEGRPNFGWLQDDLAEGRTDRMLYYAFDLLWFDGFDIRAAPLVDRKRVRSSRHACTRPGIGGVAWQKHWKNSNGRQRRSAPRQFL